MARFHYLGHNESCYRLGYSWQRTGYNVMSDILYYGWCGRCYHLPDVCGKLVMWVVGVMVVQTCDGMLVGMINYLSIIFKFVININLPVYSISCNIWFIHG